MGGRGHIERKAAVLQCPQIVDRKDVALPDDKPERPFKV